MLYKSLKNVQQMLYKSLKNANKCATKVHQNVQQMSKNCLTFRIEFLSAGKDHVVVKRHHDRNVEVSKSESCKQTYLFESLLKQVNVNHKIDRNLEIGKAKS
jgi:hypothetical protein